MDNRRLFLAALLSLSILLLWQMLFPPPPPVRTPPPSVSPESASDGSDDGGLVPEGGEPDAATPAGTEPGGAEDGPGALVSSPREASFERPVRIESERVSVELTNRGGQIRSFRLKEHRRVDDEPVELVRHRPQGPYPFAFVDAAGSALPINDALFVVDSRPAGEGQEVILTYRGPAGEASKRFVFDDGELFRVEVEARGLPEGWGLLLGPELRNPSRDALRSSLQRSFSYVRENGEGGLEELEPRKVDEERVIDGGSFRWLGFEDNYFLTVLMPEKPLRAIRVLPVLLHHDGGGAERLPVQLSAEQEDLDRGLEAVLQPGPAGLEAEVYWGAKEFERLAAMRRGLERTVRWGWFGILSRPLLFGLRWTHDNVVSNYGWSIVLMTVLIKVLLFPLTHKSYVSMQKLQKLNPRMEAIRQKYRPKLKDKQGRPNLEMQRKMNEELQQLFKEEGVNPAGGCFPILLQIPVFLAFFNLLRSAVELWGAPWILWIDDLSVPDPYYVIPIVMGATQVLQQRMTPPPPNPSQAMVIKSMPIVFTIFSLRFPAGLVLYWLTNNVLTIAQQGGYNRLKKAGFFGGEPQEEKPKRAKAQQGKRRK